MFSSIRARIVALCVAIVVVALAANAVLNYVVANGYNADSIDSSLTAVESGHVTGIDEWVAANSLMIHSLQDAVSQPDPTAALKLMASAGNFTNVYVGYADKTAKFSDPTGRAWISLGLS